MLMQKILSNKEYFLIFFSYQPSKFVFYSYIRKNFLIFSFIISRIISDGNLLSTNTANSLLRHFAAAAS